MLGHACAKAFRVSISLVQELFTELVAALRERLDVIADESSRNDGARHAARLQAVSERIEAAERNLPAAIDPQLRHFLQRRSYSKALEFLTRLDLVGNQAD